MPAAKPELLQGTLDMLILKVLDRGPEHGFGISKRIQAISRELLRVEQGSLYPALYRLEDQGLIRSTWGVSENNRKAKFYSISAAGRKQLNAERENWRRISTGIALVLDSI